jgi:hypothetical protein
VQQPFWQAGHNRPQASEKTMPGLSDYNIRRPLDPGQLDSEASEFDHGPGLTPKGLESAPPSEGGRYHGRQATIDDPPANNVQWSPDRRI